MLLSVRIVQTSLNLVCLLEVAQVVCGAFILWQIVAMHMGAHR
jgi:hypothetical protein